MDTSWARAGQASVCPNCGIGAQFSPVTGQTGFQLPGPGKMGTYARYGLATPRKGAHAGEYTYVETLACALCGDVVVHLYRVKNNEVVSATRVHPSLDAPPDLPREVPQDLRDAYTEAWRLRGVNERASAVLARRCLQLALRKEGFVAKSRNLADEIKLAEASVSPGLVDQLHIVKHVGNFAAHPIDAAGGQDFVELLEVTPGELEALFAAIDDFLDERFVRPTKRKRALEEINEKLVKAQLKPITPPSK
jgi:hypothetical protein